jgi:Methyltransferase domain
LNRIVIAQSILDAVGAETYLEIGVSTGVSFIPIKARRKWGVDPSFTLTRKRLLKYAVFSSLGIKVERLFRMTSDEFFISERTMLAAYGITVCLVDGLHTYQQSLSDVLNALAYLKPNGVILMHDCNPSTELMALPADSIQEVIERRIPKWDGEWSGDVWKTVVHVRSLRNDINAFVLDCDTGIAVITRGVPKVRLDYSQTEIQGMDFPFLMEHRKELLGLEAAVYFPEFLTKHTGKQ